MRRCVLVVVLAVGSMGLAGPAPAQSGSGPAVWVVTVDPGAGDPGVFAAKAADRFGLRVRHVYHAALRGFAAEMSPAVRAGLADDPGVARLAADASIAAAGQIVPTGVRRIHGGVTARSSSG